MRQKLLIISALLLLGSSLGVLQAQTNGGYQLKAAAACEVIDLSKAPVLITASTTQDGAIAALVDGDIANTRWGSIFADDQWVNIDLGSTYTFCKLELFWEAAAGKSYAVEVSDNGTTWKPVYAQDNGVGGNEIINFSGVGRYLRLNLKTRTGGYGFSLWELKLYGVQGNFGDSEAPTAPPSLGAVPAVYAVTLSWQPSTDNIGIASYKIYEATNLLATVDGANKSMTISGLTPGSTHTYSVFALDAAENISPASNATFTTENVVITPGDGVIAIGNVALTMPVTASSTDAAYVTSNATDGNMGSRWASASTDNEWVTVDLGLKYKIGRVILQWEAAAARDYIIQVSDDNANWTTAYTYKLTDLTVKARTDDVTFDAKGRYIRMQGIKRNSPWSYSLFEFEVYSPGSGPGDIPNPDPNPNPKPFIPGTSTFNIKTPVNGTVITTTRKPTLTWDASAGATKYEIWLNTTRTDYDWFALGSLIDRCTKVGESTTTSFTLPQDLSDRWTYKWYIVAISGTAKTYSTAGQFSIYLPIIETYDDGVNIINGCRDMSKNGVIEPWEDWHNTIDVRITNLMSLMTIEEKAYQMFYNAQSFPQSGWAFGPGTVDDMFNKQKITAKNTRLGVPFATAGDCIHGYGTSYPTQIGMAASRNLDNVRNVGNMQREEQRSVGMVGTLAPLAEVGTKVLYPRIQEGCGEDAEFAAAMVRALVCGLQGGPEMNPGSVMVTTKHWPGEGAGGEGGIVYDGVTIKYHMKPWFANVEAGAGSVMPGYAGSSFLDPAGKGAGDSKPILDYLRNVVKFDGIICTDWLPWGAWVDAANAGSDVMGGADPGAVGFVMAEFISKVGETRINESVKRILNAKFRLGIMENPYGDPVNGPKTWFTPDKQALAIDAARQSLTLIKNTGVLPLNMASGTDLLVTGARADNGDSYVIWTSYFHKDGGAKTMYQAIKEKANAKGINVYLNTSPKKPTAAIVIVGEPSYTHGTSYDKNMPWIHDAYFPVQQKSETDSTAIENVRKMGIPYVVVVISPRPYVLKNVIDPANAVILAYRPGDGGGPALAQVLFGEYAPKGKLPFQLPLDMTQVGTDNPTNALEKWDLPFDLGATAPERQEIRALIAAGTQPEPIYGKPLYQYGFGFQGYVGETTTDYNNALLTEVDSNNDNLVGIYPNPTTGILNVTFNMEAINWTIEVFDIAAIRVYNETIYPISNQSSINLNTLMPGVYTIRFSDNNVQTTKKILKN